MCIRDSDEDVQLLCSIPGIGFNSAVVIVAEMGDISLFRKPKQLAACLLYTSVTFIDNHDVTRFRYVQSNDKPFHAAIAALLTCRGTPNIYYGTERCV